VLVWCSRILEGRHTVVLELVVAVQQTAVTEDGFLEAIEPSNLDWSVIRGRRGGRRPTLSSLSDHDNVESAMVILLRPSWASMTSSTDVGDCAGVGWKDIALGVDGVDVVSGS
jgi:hypothetical protein